MGHVSVAEVDSSELSAVSNEVVKDVYDGGVPDEEAYNFVRGKILCKPTHSVLQELSLLLEFFCNRVSQ